MGTASGGYAIGVGPARCDRSLGDRGGGRALERDPVQRLTTRSASAIRRAASGGDTHVPPTAARSSSVTARAIAHPFQTNTGNDVSRAFESRSRRGAIPRPSPRCGHPSPGLASRAPAAVVRCSSRSSRRASGVIRTRPARRRSRGALVPRRRRWARASTRARLWWCRRGGRARAPMGRPSTTRSGGQPNERRCGLVQGVFSHGVSSGGVVTPVDSDTAIPERRRRDARDHSRGTCRGPPGIGPLLRRHEVEPSRQ